MGSEERESQRERERSSCCARAASASCPGSGRTGGVFGVRGDLPDVVESTERAAYATRAHVFSGERLYAEGSERSAGINPGRLLTEASPLVARLLRALVGSGCSLTRVSRKARRLYELAPGVVPLPALESRQRRFCSSDSSSSSESDSSTVIPDLVCCEGREGGQRGLGR
jgi:hypothetical protein